MMNNYNPGDTVKVFTKEEELVGMMLPRPEILKGEKIVLKLENGYNIGIDQVNIKKIELIEKYKPIQQKNIKIKHNSKLPKVSILSYGGTISSKVDYKTGGTIADLTAEDFVAMEPKLEEIANLRAEKKMSVMSEDFDWSHWISMAKDIEKELNSGADGVVVTQGTDTLHYSAAALSFLLKDVTKPVIITASQRSIDRGSSDAFMNLICAVRAAGTFDGAGVYTCLHGTSNDDYCLLIRGTKVRKMHTSRRDAFRPINELPIAKVYPDKTDIEIINKNYKKKTGDKFKSDIKYDDTVALIMIYPGMDPEIIDYYLKKKVSGIVLMATALGHVPVNGKNSPLKQIERANKQGVPVVVASQTLYGRVHPLVYTNLRKLSLGHDVIFAEDMMPEVAYVKLGWTLGHTKDKLKIKEMMLTNYAGEINERIDGTSFLY